MSSKIVLVTFFAVWCCCTRMVRSFPTGDDHSLGGGLAVDMNGNSLSSVTGFADYKINGHGLSASHKHMPGIVDISTLNAKANILDSGVHKLDANAFVSHTRLNDDFNFNTYGGHLDYNHAAGHGLKLGASHIPNVGTTMDVTGKANLFTSGNGRTSIDAFGGLSQSLNTGWNPNWNVGAGLTHRY